MEWLGKLIKWCLKTTFTVIIVFLVLILIITAFISNAAYKNMHPDKKIYSNSYLELSFPNGLKESPDEKFDLFSLKFQDMNKRNLLFYEVIQSIRQAVEDKNINGILISLDEWNISSSQTREISKVLELFKDKGKKIYAYGNRISRSNYLAAVNSDEIIMPPSKSSSVMLSGYSVSIPYYKKLGDKLGVNVNVIHIGDFKGSGENYSSDRMSENFRSSLKNLLDTQLDLFINDVAENRDIDKAVFESKLLNGEFAVLDPFQAEEFKLIDRTQHYNKFLQILGVKNNQIVNINDYKPKAEYSFSDSKIAIIFAEGAIVMSGAGEMLVENNINPGKFIDIFDEIEKDKDIKAVVLRVNSPGGSALASELILNRIADIKIPVIVSMGQVAASGGYYISSYANKIFLEDYSVTGSIGVMAMIPNFKGLTDKLGINYEKIEKGKYADLFNMTDSVSQDQIELLRRSMAGTYDEFKQRVSEGRKIDPDELEKIAQGKIWSGEQAVQNGLADEIGGIEEAIIAAADSAGLKNYSTEIFPKPMTFAEKLFKSELNEPEIRFSEKLSGTVIGSNIKHLGDALKYSNKPVLLFPYDIY